ncbi:MAG TPA: hypothetical protein VE055_05440 [Gaiellaceae bacterium]|nr:hypothetical protein [Gaiellaceae bacterium]
MGIETRMEGFEVIGCDDGKLGHVVAIEGDLLLVEEGKLRKSRHAIPKAFAHPTTRSTSCGKAIAAHYGLAEGYDDPETKGYGELTPDDPAWSAEQEEIRLGLEPDPKRRVEIREGHEPGVRGRPIIPPDPHDPV